MTPKKEKVKVSSNSSNALVLFRFPNKKQLNIIQGTAVQVKDFSKIENGFVLCTFDSKTKFHITNDDRIIRIKSFTDKKFDSTKEVSFLKYVAKITKRIQNNGLEKVVAARGLAVKKPKNYDPIDHFQKALQYKEAFVCLVYIENKLCWLCATPELLLKTDKSAIETFSLAGTVKDDGSFTGKEIIEQSIVTKDIIDKLESVSNLKKPKLNSKIISSGDLKHLLAVIKVKKKKKIKWQQLAELLHPTPAVSGYPSAKAKEFITENESLNRSFYSGFLGEIKNDEAKLYVNLRCAEISEKELFFYGGCGITIDSNPKKEWMETEHKINILRKLI